MPSFSLVTRLAFFRVDTFDSISTTDVHMESRESKRGSHPRPHSRITWEALNHHAGLPLSPLHWNLPERGRGSAHFPAQPGLSSTEKVSEPSCHPALRSAHSHLSRALLGISLTTGKVKYLSITLSLMFPYCTYSEPFLIFLLKHWSFPLLIHKGPSFILNK